MKHRSSYAVFDWVFVYPTSTVGMATTDGWRKEWQCRKAMRQSIRIIISVDEDWFPIELCPAKFQSLNIYHHFKMIRDVAGTVIAMMLRRIVPVEDGE